MPVDSMFLSICAHILAVTLVVTVVAKCWQLVITWLFVDVSQILANHRDRKRHEEAMARYREMD